MAAELVGPADAEAQLRALTIAIRHLHPRGVREFWDGVPVHICCECSQRWPCRTVEALREGSVEHSI